MKLIKEGLLPEKRIYIGTCYECGSVMEAERCELKISSDYRNGTEFTAYCMLCGKTVYFEEKKNRLEYMDGR